MDFKKIIAIIALVIMTISAIVIAIAVIKL